MTSPIPTHSHWLASGEKWMTPAAYSEKLRESERERPWEGKSDAACWRKRGRVILSETD